MTAQGLTSIKVTASVVSGRTPNVHAAMVPVWKKSAPSPGGGLGNGLPPTYIVFLTAGGNGAKAVLSGLEQEWDSVVTL